MRNIRKRLAALGLFVVSGVAAGITVKLVRDYLTDRQHRRDKDEVKCTYNRVRCNEPDDDEILDDLFDDEIAAEWDGEDLSAPAEKKTKIPLDNIHTILEDEDLEDTISIEELYKEQQDCTFLNEIENKNCALKRLLFHLNTATLDDDTLTEINKFAAEQCKLCKEEDYLYKKIRDR